MDLVPDVGPVRPAQPQNPPDVEYSVEVHAVVRDKSVLKLEVYTEVVP